MPITQMGNLNTTALVVPDIYVQIVPPSVTLLNGVPTNVLAVVGTASWGPINAPTVIGSMADYVRLFGPVQNRKYDMGSVVAQAIQQGANNILCVRVANSGTAVASSRTFQDSASANCIVFTSKYTGRTGDGIRITLAPGVNNTVGSPTVTVTVAMAGREAEIFPNIAGTTGAGATLWSNVANAINNGMSGVRGPSEMVAAGVGGMTGTANVAGATSSNLTSGNDGIGANDAAHQALLIGTSATPRTGMYSLTGSAASVGVLADYDNKSNWNIIAQFGLQEGIYFIVSGNAGETPATAVSDKQGAGAVDYSLKVMYGDHVYWYDQFNAVTRMVPPSGFVAGRLVNLSPEQSSLNKPLYGIVNTQKTAQNQTYSSAELQTLIEAGIDVITNPSPGGYYYSCRSGHNASLNPVINGDNYTRLTNYISSTLEAGMGIYVGKLQSPDVRRQAKATLDTFLSNMEGQGQIGNADGTIPFSVRIDSANNPPSRVALGYLQADVKVQYLSVIEKFLINVEGGQSVKVERLTTDFAG